MKDPAKNQSTEKIILGIDPGTTVMGYGLISTEGKKYKILQFGGNSPEKIRNPRTEIKEDF